jgi:hypothetical protein
MADQPGDSWQRWQQRRQAVVKPRVSKCNVTAKWIVNVRGLRHACSHAWKSDRAFSRWADALAEANTVYRDQLERQAWLFAIDNRRSDNG